MSLSTRITDSLALSYLKTTGVTGTSAADLSYAPTLRYSLTMATGIATGLADLLYAGTRTLALSTSEDLDLAGGLTDVFGATLTFVKIKMIYISAAAANTNTVVVGGAASNQFVGPFGASTHTIAIQPGATMKFIHPLTGWAVTAGTGDLLKVLNGGAGTSVTYDLVICGTSA